MTGYVRQKNLEIQNGNVIDADAHAAEYNQVEGAFNSSTGHVHDGSIGEGAPITKVGPLQDLEITASALQPKTNNTLDLGTASFKFKDGRFQGTLTVDGGVTGALTGNASTATVLQTARTINGTSFNGSANITTANWGTSRNITIGGTTKAVNGSGNVSWSLGEIGVNNNTLTLATSGIATGSQTWTANQGSNATFTVNVPGTNLGSSGSGTTRTITSSTGSNTSITFTASDLNAVPTGRTITTGDGLNGGGNLNANRTFSVDNTVVRTSGNQTIGGAKSFSSQINAMLGITSGLTGVPLSISDGVDVSGAVTAVSFSGNGSSITSLNASSISSGTLNAARLPSTAVLTSRTIATGDGLSGGGNLTANRTISVDSSVLRDTGDQTISGNKNFNTLFTGTAGSNTGDFLSTSALKVRTTSTSRAGDVSIESYGNDTSARNHIVFNNPNGDCGSISTLTSSTAFNTTSDYRRKNVIGPVEDAAETLMALKPIKYSWKVDETNTPEIGFLAHEVQEVIPGVVTGEKDGPEYQQMDHSKLVPLLTAALQNALRRIEELEAKVGS